MLEQSRGAVAADSERYRDLVRSLLDVVPLADALAVMSEAVKETNDAAAMLQVAALEGEQSKPLIESRSGASYGTEEAGEHLGKTSCARCCPRARCACSTRSTHGAYVP